TTALYGLGLSLNQSGQRDEGRTVMAQFQKVKDAKYGVELGSKYLEQGRYAEAITSTGAETDLVDTATPDVTFTEAVLGGAQSPSSESGGGGVRVVGRAVGSGEWNDGARRELAASLAGGVTLFDFDGDGDLDVFEVTAAGQ